MEYTKSTIYHPEADVYYVPFVADDGRVGYRVVSTADTNGRETFIYLNPSTGPDDANVFVYEGIENDPAEDSAVVFVTPEGLVD
jgi:hypothetical protein